MFKLLFYVLLIVVAGGVSYFILTGKSNDLVESLKNTNERINTRRNRASALDKVRDCASKISTIILGSIGLLVSSLMKNNKTESTNDISSTTDTSVNNTEIKKEINKENHYEVKNDMSHKEEKENSKDKEKDKDNVKVEQKSDSKDEDGVGNLTAF